MLLGLGLALLASGALEPVLYHVNLRDSAVFVAVAATLAFASLIASFLPARDQDRSGGCAVERIGFGLWAMAREDRSTC